MSLFNNISNYLHLASSFYISNLITFKHSEKITIDQHTRIRILSKPKKANKNIFIIQGGVYHKNKNSMQLRLTSLFIKKNIRIFAYEKDLPVVNFLYSHDIHKCLKYIKSKFNGKLIVIGYSMGGILLLNYLSYGYDDADLYIPTCCPLDFERFEYTINNNFIFKYILNQNLKAFNVNNMEELFNLAGINLQSYKEFYSNFADRLKKSRKIWKNKTIYIVGSEDPLTITYKNYKNILPKTCVVIKGWHCCIDCIIYAVNYSQSL